MSDLTPPTLNTLNPRTPDSAHITETLERNARPASPDAGNLNAAAAGETYAHREPAPGEPPLPDNDPPLPGDPLESPPAPEIAR